MASADLTFSRRRVLRDELIGLYGVVERNLYLTKRYFLWDLAFLLWTIANTLTIVFISQGVNLSAADQKKMDEFRQCMQDNGAPGPPDPSNIDPSNGPPKPPSAADREKIQKAFEACKDKLPSGMQAGPPRIGTCGPPPGVPAQPGKQQNQDQSNQSGTSSSGSSS